jgi:4-amino-4-deoxy-L-arabinose transferase-like glycosyltransferase
MAVFERFAGRESVFWVVPLLGGVLVWASYLLGARLYGAPVGALAAVLVATAPPVLIQLTSAPMSDLPAAAWWTLAFVLASFDRRLAAAGTGMAAGLAILTRPNLVPVLAIVVALLAGRLIVAKRPFRDVFVHVLLFSLVAIPACFAVAALNNALWGSAVQSGYGSLGQLFSVANVWTNLVVYPRAVVTLLPVAVLAPIAWFVHRERFATLSLGAWAVVVVLIYLVFPAYDAQFSLRFLVPAIPPVMVLVSVTAYSLAGQLAARHQVASFLVIAAVAGSGVHTARSLRAFDLEHERRYAAIGHYIARELPERAVLLAMLHSGSANYYSGRPTIRYDLMSATRLDPLVEILRQRGYVPYLLIDSDERAAFQAQYREHSRLGALDWPPLVRMHSPPVEIYPVPSDDSQRP